MGKQKAIRKKEQEHQLRIKELEVKTLELTIAISKQEQKTKELEVKSNRLSFAGALIGLIGGLTALITAVLQLF